MNWEVFTKLSTIQVQLHWLSAVVALFLGLAILAIKKGTLTHVFFGRVWVGTMVVVSLSAVFINEISSESPVLSLAGFSPIHLLIPLTLILLFYGVRNARRGNIGAHKKIMIITFFSSLVIAGAFTFLPGRHMHTFFFGATEQVENYIQQGYKK